MYILICGVQLIVQSLANVILLFPLTAFVDQATLVFPSGVTGELFVCVCV